MTQAQRNNYDNLYIAVSGTAKKWQEQYFGEYGDSQQAQARARFAKIRQAAALPLESNPLNLQRVLMTMTPNLEVSLLGHGDAASPSEWAAFQSLSFFAVHMQGATKEAHNTECSFAQSCGQLYRRRDSASLKPRFDAIVLARAPKIQVKHIHPMISLLRTERLSFDYGRLAEDLRSFHSPDRRAGVLLRWSRDFVRGAQMLEQTPDNQ